MKYLILFLASLTLGAALAQKAETIKLADLNGIIKSGTQEIAVINFWATWCGPCVKELPLFEKLNASRMTTVSVTLVSLDLDLDPNPEKVYKFVERKKLQSHVVLLDEKDPNTWIDKIDPAWSGALPATLVVNRKTGQRKFIEKELHEGDLEKIIQELQTGNK